MENKSLKNSWAIAFTVASIWFGTHVGGGFASGNQIIGYFAQFGSLGSLIFPLISMGLLAFVMSIMLKFARLNGFDNYKDTFSALYPKPWMEIFFEIFYIVIILAAVAAAVAGAGEVRKEAAEGALGGSGEADGEGEGQDGKDTFHVVMDIKICFLFTKISIFCIFVSIFIQIDYEQFLRYRKNPGDGRTLRLERLPSRPCRSL